jgi:hypothetical protein
MGRDTGQMNSRRRGWAYGGSVQDFPEAGYPGKALTDGAHQTRPLAFDDKKNAHPTR